MRVVIRSLSLALLLIGASAQAQSDRAGTWEVGASLLDLSSTSIGGPQGTSLQVDDETGFGFFGAYNFTNRLAVGMDLNYSDPAYVATLVPDGIGPTQSVSANLGVDVIHFKAIFNLLDDDFTPFFEVGAGWTYLDSNIVEGYSGSVCWWDPWWGYVCNNYYDTYTDTRTSHSYAVGVRWDLQSTMVLRAAWGVHDIDTSRSSEDIELDTIQLTFGWRF